MKDNIKLICFDVDGTLIEGNGWFRLNIALGITPQEDKEMYDQYVSGELSYTDWIKKLETMYLSRGLANRENIDSTLADYTLMPEAKDTINYLKKKGYEVVIISGGFGTTLEHLAHELGITNYKANTSLEFDDNGQLTTLVSQGDENTMKPLHLNEICERLSMKITECASIGDGGNDLKLFAVTGHGITFDTSSDIMKRAAEHTIHQLGDLKHLF